LKILGDIYSLEKHSGNFLFMNSGAVDALTDGLMLLRYAFGLRGESLIRGAVSTQGLRNTATNIEAYIESHMP
jgi:hypothetical protein